MSAPNMIGVAFLGAGRMDETHLRNLAGLNGVRVVEVADPNGEAAKRGEILANAETALTDIEKAITYPGVDAVVIVAPAETHAQLVRADGHSLDRHRWNRPSGRSGRSRRNGCRPDSDRSVTQRPRDHERQPILFSRGLLK
jgi:Oxidoreductase family, NAD-binding Rossmann fold